MFSQPLELSGNVRYYMLTNTDEIHPPSLRESTFTATFVGKQYVINLASSQKGTRTAYYDGTNSWNTFRAFNETNAPIVTINESSLPLDANYEIDAFFCMAGLLGYIDLQQFTNRIKQVTFLKINEKFKPEVMSVRIDKDSIGQPSIVSVYQEPFNYVDGKLLPWQSMDYGYRVIRAEWTERMASFRYLISMPTKVPDNPEDVGILELVEIQIEKAATATVKAIDNPFSQVEKGTSFRDYRIKSDGSSVVYYDGSKPVALGDPEFLNLKKSYTAIDTRRSAKQSSSSSGAIKLLFASLLILPVCFIVALKWKKMTKGK